VNRPPPPPPSQLDFVQPVAGMDGDSADPDTVGSAAEPEGLLCPIMHVMYRDPCFVPGSGNTYERSAIRRYWSSARPPRDPLTNVTLSSTDLHPNWGKRREVQAFLDEHPDYVPQGWADRNVPSVVQQRSSRVQKPALPIVVAVVVALVGWAATQLASPLVHELQRSPLTLLGREKINGEVLHPPRGSLLNATRQGDYLIVYLPPIGLQSDSAGQIVFSFLWIGFTGVWTRHAIRGGAPLLFAGCSLPFWAVGMSTLSRALMAPFVSEALSMDSNEYFISRRLAGLTVSSVRGLVGDLAGPPLRSCDEDSCQVVFEDGVQEHSFGNTLRVIEAKWLQKQLQEQLSSSGMSQSVPEFPERRNRQQRGDFAHQRGLSSGPGGFHFGFIIR